MPENNEILPSLEQAHRQNKSPVRTAWDLLQNFRRRLWYTPEEYKRFQQFRELREQVITEMNSLISERIRRNPRPTEEEYRIGAFVEELEPQVRDAVLKLNRKGYSTISSGFGGEHRELQVIEGQFELDEDTKINLRKMGVIAQFQQTITSEPEIAFFRANRLPYRFGRIAFRPNGPDLAEMKATWDLIAKIVPDLGHIAEPSETDAAEHFRINYPQALNHVNLDR